MAGFEGQVSQVLEKEVTCSICLGIFKEPKKLPCDHVYCKECLRGLALKSHNATISCPECRTHVQVPGNDVDNIPTAFRVNRLVEVFQEVNVAEMCQVHPAQPLAIYCETCKKQLCRDCMLMSIGEHANHEHGYFEEMAAKYREKLVGKKSLINSTQKPSISTALKEITAVESGIANHEQKCQDDIEHTFEEMISVLQTCKQAMKDEATAYYSSLTGVFDQQKERLKAVLHQAESAVEANLQDDGHSFFERLESTFERIDRLQKEVQSLSFPVAQPRLIAIQAADVNSLEQYVKQNYFICELAQADMCTCSFDGSMKLYFNEQTSFTLTLRNPRGIIHECQDRVNTVDVTLVNVHGKSTNGDTKQLPQGQVKILLTPKIRGLQQLNVKINGVHIQDSPFTVTVYMPPNLLQPTATLSGMKRPGSLVYSQAEDNVIVTVVDEGIIRKVDSEFHLLPNKFVVLPQVGEITEYADSETKVFYVTTLDNRIHKLSNSGRIIKSVGKTGKEIAEFNFPNGLRVSKKQELYVCDSNNHRVQVFDLNLNYLRSFGEYGSGNKQFNFPADVDFDSRGNIYITETKNHRIQVFTCEEYHIRTVAPNDPKVNLFLPVSMIMHDENMYVTDRYNHKVWVMSTSGEVITTFGDGILKEPEGITMDKAGFVYVTSGKKEIVVF